jgi:hypothetical protein
MNLSEKIDAASSIMDRVSSRNRVGPHGGIYLVIEILEKIQANHAIHGYQQIDTHIFQDLKSLNMSLDEIKALRETRERSRHLIQAKISQIVDDLGKTFDVAEIELQQILSYQRAPTWLTAKDIADLTAAKIHNVDIMYVFTYERLNIVRSLLDLTTLTAAQSFDYVDYKVGGPAAAQLIKDLQHHAGFILDQVYPRAMANPRITAEEIFTDLLHITRNDNTLNPEYLALVCTKKLAARINQLILSKEIFQETFPIGISPTLRDYLPPTLKAWSLCQTEKTNCMNLTDLQDFNNHIRAMTRPSPPAEIIIPSLNDEIRQAIAYFYRQEQPDNPIHTVFKELEKTSNQQNISLTVAGELIKAGKTNSTSLTHIAPIYIALGCDPIRLSLADELRKEVLDTACALRLVARTSLLMIENLAAVLTGKLSGGHLAQSNDVSFENLTPDDIFALEQMLYQHKIDLQPALYIVHDHAGAILSGNMNNSFNVFNYAKGALANCNIVSASRFVKEHEKFLHQLATDCLAIPIADQLVTCVDQYLIKSNTTQSLPAGTYAGTATQGEADSLFLVMGGLTLLTAIGACAYMYKRMGGTASMKRYASTLFSPKPTPSPSADTVPLMIRFSG